jgi:hypothetical protein
MLLVSGTLTNFSIEFEVLTLISSSLIDDAEKAIINKVTLSVLLRLILSYNTDSTATDITA